ncbi:MAG: HAD family hydrolase [Rhodospirillales bacterium]|nr:HAD family hydrolase [Rhodospirillales bacterium]
MPNVKAREAVRGILFDKDGTLLDFIPTWLPAYRAGALHAAGGDESKAQKMLQATGFNEGTNDFVHGSLLASGTTDEIAKAWLELGPEQSLKELIPELDQIFADVTAHSSKPFPGLMDLIMELDSQDIVLGVATNDSEISARAFLKFAKIEAYFPFVVGYDSGHGSKPATGMIDAFCTAHDLPAAAVMVVGDNHCDLEMGQDANAGYVVGVLSGNGTHGELEPFADAIIDGIGSFYELELGH